MLSVIFINAVHSFLSELMWRRLMVLWLWIPAVATKRFVWSECFIKNNMMLNLQKNTKNTKWIKVKVVKKHSTWTSEGGNKLNCACGTNQLLYTMSHKKQYVEKYPHIIRNFLTYWFTDWAKNQSSIYYEILHRTLLSYTVVLKSSLNYSTIILRLLKEKTHLYMWNHPKCQSQS